MRYAAFSADVEDYYQAEALRGFFPRARWADMEDRTEANVDRLLVLLDRAGVKGTFFILGWTAERHPGMVERIAAQGHEIASHGYDHELVYRQSRKEFRQDVGRAKRLLEDMSGRAVSGYRAPSYTIMRRTEWALPILAEEGYRYDSSVFPIRRRRYGMPDAPRWPHRIPLRNGNSELVEYPLPTLRFGGVNVPVTGGAYLRLLPMWFQKWGVRKVLATNKGFVLNVHPWELDPEQPRLPVGLRTRWTHYHNLSRTAERLSSLLEFCRFRPQGEVLRDLGLLQ